MKVQLFAGAADAVGESAIEIEAVRSVGDLRSQLLRLYPALGKYHHSLLIAVNHAYASDETSIPETAEVACFPPVSGG